MAQIKKTNVLTPEYLKQLYWGAINNSQVCAAVSIYMEEELLPTQDFQALHVAISKHYMTYKSAPKYGIIKQTVASSRAVVELLDEIHDEAQDIDSNVLLEQLEKYLKLTMFQRAYKEIGKTYQGTDGMEAVEQFYAEAEKIKRFTLKQEEFVDVVKTFHERYINNMEKHNENSAKKAITSFYIHKMDEMNHGRNLRGQLSMFLAKTGVGKSHIARHIGTNACYTSGLDVLHIQLEGSTSETTDAYSAGMVGCESYLYESGRINDHALKQYEKLIELAAGTLVVRGFPKFGKKVTTIDINNVLDEYQKKYGKNPDVMIIDSGDLLDPAEKNRGKDDVRQNRINMTKEIKDIAGERDLWAVVTYQANVPDPKLTEDESFVLTEHNCSEAKGVSYAVTHLVTLNQTSKERKERVMRLYFAKSRFFPQGEPIKIATDYEHERFYSPERTLNMAT